MILAHKDTMAPGKKANRILANYDTKAPGDQANVITTHKGSRGIRLT